MLASDRTVFGLGLVLCLLSPSFAADFDRLEGEELAEMAKGNHARQSAGLGFSEIDALPSVLPDSRSAFFVVKTSLGNYSRILATAALRKPPEGEGKPVPVVVLERFDTFEPGKSGSRLARGTALILFEGFQVDLDTGQVVPDGFGGDLKFEKRDKGDGLLKSLATATFFTFDAKLPAPAVVAGPSPGKAILPGDFTGRYRLLADGRFRGLLEIEANADRTLIGRFRSEPNGTSYPVTGEVLAEAPQKARFKIKFPRSEQEYDAYLWTEGKNVLAGSFTMLDRTFGFFAIRDGSKQVLPD